MPDLEMVPALDVARVREDFPILAQRLEGDLPLVYLDNGASTQIPRQVLAAIVALQTGYYANVHRGVHRLSERSTEAFEAAREHVRRFIGARSTQEVIFTAGTTASINLVARSYVDAFLRAGDEILLTEMEHHSNHVPWLQACERTGAVVKFIPITDEGRLDVAECERLLSPRTKLVALTAVSNVLGTINPLAELIPKFHAAGAVVLVDGAQSVPHFPTDVASLDVDFLAFSAHKMCGVSGVGVLYAKAELLDKMPPFLGGGSMIRRVEKERFTVGDLPNKFEAGTPPIMPAIALGAAIEYLEQVGLPSIVRHEDHLARLAYDALSAVPGLKIYGPPASERAGILSFSLHRSNGRLINGNDVAQLLDEQGVAVRVGHHCTMPLHERLGVPSTTRASFYLYNTPEEIEYLATAIERVRLKFERRKG